MKSDLDNKVSYLREEYRKSSAHEERRKGGGGGESGGGGDMEKRVEAIEKVIPEIRERLVRVETRLEAIGANMATKADLVSATSKTDASVAALKTETQANLASLKADTQASISSLSIEIQSMETRLIKWFVSTAFAMTGVATAIAFGLARLLK